MKLNKYIWLAALPMLFTACQEDALVENHQGLEGKFVLKASVDKEGSFSRAQIKLKEQGNGQKYGAFQWDEGDEFRMFEVVTDEDWNESLGATHDFTISGYSNSSPSNSATFVSETTPADGNQFYAYYPSLDVNADGETITMTLNNMLTDNSADSWKEYFNENMYMIAEGSIRGSETMLRFSHQCGLVNVAYTNESSSAKYIKGISMNGDWGISKNVKVLRPGNKVTGEIVSDGYGITFETPAVVQPGNTENFFILFIQPSWIGSDEVEKMSRLTILYTDDANSSTTAQSTDDYTVGMPTFYGGQGYRLNVKETAEGKLVWTKAPVVEGFKVSTPAELVAALQEKKDSIALGADIVLEAPLNIDYDVTLDLVGYKISMHQDKLDEFKNSEDALIVVHRGGALTINDLSDGNGVIEPGINYPTSTIKMIGKDDDGMDLAKLTLNEGNLVGYNVISGTKGKGNTEIIINGGDINGSWDVDYTNGKGATGIFHPQSGTLTINGGYVWGCQSAIEMRAGNLVINGGTISYNIDWNEFREPTTANATDGTTMRGCVAIGISQGDDNLPLNVTINEGANINTRGEETYAIYEVDLHDNNTDNVTINIKGTESRHLGVSGLIYSENKKGFLGSYTTLNNPACLSYIAKGAKNVRVECEGSQIFTTPSVSIPDSEEGNGAEVEVNLNKATWTIKSGDANNNYFYVGKNNSLTLHNGTISVPEDAVGVSLIKANDAKLNFQNVTINSYNLHYAVDIEDGKVRFLRTNIIAGENCYAFNILASSLEREEPMFDLMENCEVNGCFKLGVAELPETADPSDPPILYMDNVDIDGDLFVSENITNDWLYYCVHYNKDSVDFTENSTGWDSVQNATDEDLPALPVYITDLNWIAVIEASYGGENVFVKNSEGYVSVDNLTNKSIIESITSIVFDYNSDYSAIEKLQYIEKFKSLETIRLRNTSVSALDLSNNISLTNVEVYNNKLDTFIVAGCNQLESLECTDDYLVQLDLSECGQSLTYVSLNLPSLTDLDISNCQILDRLRIDESNLSSLSLPETTKVKYLELEGTSIKSLDVNQCLGLEYLYCHLPLGLTSLNLVGCEELKEVTIGSNGGGDYESNISEFSVYGCPNLKKVELSQYNSVQMDANIENCPSLETVRIYDCKTLEISGCDNLKTLGCSEGSLASLDVSACTSLQKLYCGNNQLSELIFAENSVLEELSCGLNQLTKLDVSSHTELKTLYCYNNQLNELIVEGLNNLEELICGDNLLTTLSVKDLPSLRTLECGFNRLTSLDVSDMLSLENLDYRGNAADLDLLNLSGLSFITELDLMDYNTHYDSSVTYKIKELNVSNCSNLTKITFYEGIGLETLDISSRSSGQLPDNPNLITFANTGYVKGLKKIKLDQWHFDWYDDIYGVWGSFTSGEQNQEVYLKPYHYKGYQYPVFEYPNGYTTK